ncbi:metallophosphoesterase [Argonema antarcticum]|uniref:metallophosphoesterase n=1 Tax=Argonema antarcticum TaxID=2942763 RepID=UPI002013735A|nr:metallophosphoesterase [Argonema antarcticum]MCL1475861.1 metallophosphoesterase [Argonema antarcticum A004/B2]
MKLPKLSTRFPLEIGTSAPLLIRQESVHLGLGGEELKLLFASDLHLGGRHSLQAIDRLVTAVTETKPNLVLLGGDLVDFRWGIPLLESCVLQLVAQAPVWAISGNHDVWVGMTAVRRAVETGGGFWLEESSLKVSTIRIDGFVDRDRTSKALRILCAHNPAVFSQAVASGYSLVLAGHLHGCQWVFWEHQSRLYPGAWFYQWNGLRFELNNATLIVSRGMGDTLPVRWNCPREVILCKIF